MNVDLQCLVELARFTRRHRRYGLIAALLLAVSLPAWRRRRVLRTGFCFLQLVDDWLDGDRPCDRDPVAVVRELQQEIRAGAWSDRPVSRLGAALVADLAPASVERLLALLDTMAEDGERRRTRSTWPADRLRAHHRATFGGSLDLLLAAVGAEARSAAVPELLDAFGVVSTLRDLDEDLARGLCNVPAELVEGPWEDLPGRPAVQAWLAAERAVGRAALQATDRRLPALDAVTARVVRFFLPSMRRALSG